MLFNSLRFLIFFPVVTALYFLMPHRVRWLLLLCASVYFYMVFRPVYILILAFTIVVDYYAGILIESSEGRKRKYWLLASIFANTGVLAFFKYYNFLNESLRQMLGTAHIADPVPYLNILLPIGLSFHVFQSLSYTIEVYRGRQRAERHAGIFALYVMFYPQLVAGPIERPQNLLWQFRTKHEFDYERVVSGLQLMMWGYFKKVVVADRLAPFVNQVYDHPGEYRAISYVFATIYFSFQIYCDFSGYSDIALGAAQVMGFSLMKNFDRPYFSRSIGEFWKRWHISLSTWFRDYLYISLGGNRTTRPRWFFNLMVTFLVSGLWHGANWTYVIWGGLNGLYLIGEIVVSRRRQRGAEMARESDRWPVIVFQTLRTFALTCFAWLFFRAHSVSDAFHMVGTVVSPAGNLIPDLMRLIAPTGANLHFVHMYILMEQPLSECIIAFCAVGVLLGMEYLQGDLGSIRLRLRAQGAWVRWAVYYASLTAIIFLGAFHQSQQFIYFQF